MGLNTQAAHFRVVKHEEDEGKAQRQVGKDLAADKKQGMVQIARRIARELAQHGPITIDDVTRKMVTHYNVAPAPGKRNNQWKGSVFSTSEWKQIGKMASTVKTAHARPVGLWALKSWLADNSLNGKSTTVSAFVLSRIYREFKQQHANCSMGQCHWHIGEEKLCPEIMDGITRGQNKLYGAHVTLVPGSVGAILSPRMAVDSPNPSVDSTTPAEIRKPYEPMENNV